MNLRLALIVWCAACALLKGQGSGPCKPSASTADGYGEVSFSLPAGSLQLMFPAVMVNGESVTSAVIISPQGTTDTDKAANRAKLEALRVESNTKLFSTKNGSKIIFTAQKKIEQRLLILREAGGEALCQIAIPIQPGRKGISQPDRATETDYDVSPVVQDGEPLRVWGPFDGDLANTEVQIQGRRAAPLGESSGEFIVQSPAGLSGEVEIGFTERNITVRRVVRYVNIKVVSPEPNRKKDWRSILFGTPKVTAEVSGLQRLAEPLRLVFADWFYFLNCGMDGCGGPTVGTASKQVLITPDKITAEGKFSTSYSVGRTGSLTVRVSAASPRLRVGEVTQDTTRTWSIENGVEITPAAQALILKGFEEQEQNGHLKELLAGPRTYNWNPNTLLAFLVRQYLYELRDGIGAKPMRASVPSAFILAFQAGPQGSGKVIEAIQAAGHTVADYLRTVARTLRGDVASYRFVSTPQPLDLFLDGEYAGSTITEKVLSPKSYSVVIRPRKGNALCEMKVTVKLGPPEEVRCPPEN